MKKLITSKKQAEHQNLPDRKAGLLLIALMIICVFLSLTLILRAYHGKPIFPTGESYYNMRMANSLVYNGVTTQDPLQETYYAPSPYHFFLSFFLFVFNSYSVLWFIPIFLGLASALLFFRLLTIMGAHKEQAFYALLILAVTPVFIVVFTGLYLLGWLIFLSLLSFALLTSKRKMPRMVGMLCFIILALSSLVGFIIASMVFLMMLILMKRKLNALIAPAIASLAAVIIMREGFGAFDFKETLSLLGANIGFDLFLLLIFFIGFVVLWSRSKSTRLIHLSTLLLVMLSFFNSIARAFASFIIAYYCVVTLTYLYNRKWSLDIIKTGTMLLVLCSLVFSLVNQVNLIVTAQPDALFVKSLMFLDTLEPGRVLTDESYGLLVEFYSDNNVLLDGNSIQFTKDYARRKDDSQTLFNSARLIEAQPLLEEYEIRYVLITPGMKEQLWDNNERGLWFLVKNSESFEKRYLEEGIEIREYKPATPVMPAG